MRSMLLFALGLIFCLFARAQAIHYVKSGGIGDGSDWSSPMGSLQVAIDGANAGDQIWVAAGNYYGTSANHYGIVLKEGVSLYGGFAVGETAVDQRDLASHVTKIVGGYSSVDDNILKGTNITSATVIDGFTLTPYSLPAISRGIYLNNSSPVFKSCIITGNHPNSVTSTHSGNGMGVYMESGSQPLFLDCTFSDNQSLDYGGAIYSDNSTPSFVNCRFLNNKSSKFGGGSYHIGSSASYYHCLFQGNMADALTLNRGGGVSFNGGNASVLNNCLFTGNQAGTDGAAIYCNEAGLSILNCTISENTAHNQIGGGAISYSETGANTLTITNSIIWNNISDHGDYGSSQLYEILALPGSAGAITGNNLIKYGQYSSIDADPKFVDATLGNFQLQQGSPAIDQGNTNALDPATDTFDLAGNHRVINSIVDLGAYEAITDQIINNGASVFNGFAGSLDITGNKYENDLENLYKWKMIVSSTTINDIFVVDPSDLSAYSGLFPALGITFDSTHFQVNDLSVMPTLMEYMTGVAAANWAAFNGDIIVSRVVYPNQVQADSLVSNAETITMATPLPVTVKQFSGRLQNGVANLRWQTGPEIGFDHFELEKSLDGKAYNKLTSKAASGSDHLYQLTLPQLDKSAYYRLKIVNKDGTSSYYDKVLMLTQSKLQVATVHVYPNPGISVIHIRVTGPATVHLYNASGAAVKSVSVQAGLNSVDIRSLSKGVYFGKLSTGGRFKFIKQ